MDALNKNAFLLVAGLSAMAGFVDAVGFLHLGGYFISFMSGNSTRLAVNLAQQHGEAVGELASILALFVLGTMSGVLMRQSIKGQPALGVMLWVSGLLTAAAAAWEVGLEKPAVVMMVLAMGAENTVLVRHGDVVGLTYMTGTLAKIGQRLAEAVSGGRRSNWLPYLLLWVGMVSGGACGALMFSWFGLRSLWAAAAWAGMLTAVTALAGRRLGI